MAYENHAGPVDNRWRDEMTAQIHELLQFMTHLQGAAMSDKKNPNQVPKPEKVDRPWVHERDDEEEDDDGMTE